jgi:hypothetical protein
MVRTSNDRSKFGISRRFRDDAVHGAILADQHRISTVDQRGHLIGGAGDVTRGPACRASPRDLEDALADEPGSSGRAEPWS